MAEYVSLAMREAAKDATMLLYASGTDLYFEGLTRNADLIFYFQNGSKAVPRIKGKTHPKVLKSQTIREVFS